jgi:hypothetical protein
VLIVKEKGRQPRPRSERAIGLVAAGLSNDDIARRLYVSQSNAKTHVARAMIKLAARDRPSWWWPPTSPARAARAGPAPRRNRCSARPRPSAYKQQAKSNPQTRHLERTVPFASTVSTLWTRR